MKHIIQVPPHAIERLDIINEAQYHGCTGLSTFLIICLMFRISLVPLPGTNLACSGGISRHKKTFDLLITILKSTLVACRISAIIRTIPRVTFLLQQNQNRVALSRWLKSVMPHCVINFPKH